MKIIQFKLDQINNFIFSFIPTSEVQPDYYKEGSVVIASAIGGLVRIMDLNGVACIGKKQTSGSVSMFMLE